MEKHEEICRLVGGNLRRIRVTQGLTQIQLSVKTGLTHIFINEVENGKKWLSSTSLADVASVLKAAPYQFFQPEGENENFSEDFSNMPDSYLIEFSNALEKMAQDLQYRYGKCETETNGGPQDEPLV